MLVKCSMVDSARIQGKEDVVSDKATVRAILRHCWSLPHGVVSLHGPRSTMSGEYARRRLIGTGKHT
jgi:hypothetical protein